MGNGDDPLPDLPSQRLVKHERRSLNHGSTDATST